MSMAIELELVEVLDPDDPDRRLGLTVLALVHRSPSVASPFESVNALDTAARGSYATRSRRCPARGRLGKRCASQRLRG